MQWWGAITKQFTELATSAMKESAGDAARSLATAMVKQGVDAAGQTMKKATSAPAPAAGTERKPAPRKRATKSEG